MRDVAARLGVSPMTVSRAIRGERGIAEPTRARVLAEVAALGYRRNDLARRLRSGQAHELIGLVVTSLANPFYAQLAVGMEEVATEQGFGLLIAATGADLGRERDLVADMAARRIAGLVVVPCSNDHDHLRAEALSGSPVVLAATPPRGIEVDYVLVDDFGGMYAACRELIAQGHQHIGFLGLPAASWTGSERYRGFAAAMEDAGLEIDESSVHRHRSEVDQAEAAARRLLAQPEPVTALLTANNRNTIGALRVLQQHRAPIALAGFDDIESADLFRLPFSLVAYDAEQVGREAARLLLTRVGPTSPESVAPHSGGSQRVIIPTHLVTYPTLVTR